MATKSSKTAPATKPPSKSELLAKLAEETGLSRKQVSSVFESLSNQMKKNLGGRGPGLFVVPGLMKIKVIKKPATKARKGTNPFTGEEMMFKAKPARKIVRARPVKAAKDAV